MTYTLILCIGTAAIMVMGLVAVTVLTMRISKKNFEKKFGSLFAMYFVFALSLMMLALQYRYERQDVSSFLFIMASPFVAYFLQPMIFNRNIRAMEFVQELKN